MKLRAEQENLVGDDAYFDYMESLEHNAACARALMQAMEKMAWPAHRETLIERADEIMHEWGFDSGEVE